MNTILSGFDNKICFIFILRNVNHSYICFVLLQKGILQEHKPEQKKRESIESFEDTPLYIAVLTYLGYAILIIFGHFRDFLRRWKIENVPMAAEPVKTVSIKS